MRLSAQHRLACLRLALAALARVGGAADSHCDMGAGVRARVQTGQRVGRPAAMPDGAGPQIGVRRPDDSQPWGHA
jgi:hypothetical protein